MSFDKSCLAYRRGARLLAVVSEASSKGASRVDGKAVSRLLQAGQEVGASQFILVAPSGSGGGGGGGFLGGLFGGGGSSVGGSGARLSKIEQVTHLRLTLELRRIHSIPASGTVNVCCFMTALP